jgi:hypothetical protein
MLSSFPKLSLALDAPHQASLTINLQDLSDIESLASLIDSINLDSAVHLACSICGHLGSHVLRERTDIREDIIDKIWIEIKTCQDPNASACNRFFKVLVAKHPNLCARTLASTFAEWFLNMSRVCDSGSISVIAEVILPKVKMTQKVLSLIFRAMLADSKPSHNMNSVISFLTRSQHVIPPETIERLLLKLTRTSTDVVAAMTMSRQLQGDDFDAVFDSFIEKLIHEDGVIVLTPEAMKQLVEGCRHRGATDALLASTITNLSAAITSGALVVAIAALVASKADWCDSVFSSIMEPLAAAPQVMGSQPLCFQLSPWLLTAYAAYCSSLVSFRPDSKPPSHAYSVCRSLYFYLEEFDMAPEMVEAVVHCFSIMWRAALRSDQIDALRECMGRPFSPRNRPTKLLLMSALACADALDPSCASLRSVLEGAFDLAIHNIMAFCANNTYNASVTDLQMWSDCVLSCLVPFGVQISYAGPHLPTVIDAILSSPMLKLESPLCRILSRFTRVLNGPILEKVFGFLTRSDMVSALSVDGLLDFSSIIKANVSCPNPISLSILARIARDIDDPAVVAQLLGNVEATCQKCSNPSIGDSILCYLLMIARKFSFSSCGSRALRWASAWSAKLLRGRVTASVMVNNAEEHLDMLLIILEDGYPDGNMDAVIHIAAALILGDQIRYKKPRLATQERFKLLFGLTHKQIAHVCDVLESAAALLVESSLANVAATVKRIVDASASNYADQFSPRSPVSDGDLPDVSDDEDEDELVSVGAPSKMPPSSRRPPVSSNSDLLSLLSSTSPSSPRLKKDSPAVKSKSRDGYVPDEPAAPKKQRAPAPMPPQPKARTGFTEAKPSPVTIPQKEMSPLAYDFGAESDSDVTDPLLMLENLLVQPVAQVPAPKKKLKKKNRKNPPSRNSVPASSSRAVGTQQESDTAQLVEDDVPDEDVPPEEPDSPDQ